MIRRTFCHIHNARSHIKSYYLQLTLCFILSFLVIIEPQNTCQYYILLINIFIFVPCLIRNDIALCGFLIVKVNCLIIIGQKVMFYKEMQIYEDLLTIIDSLLIDTMAIQRQKREKFTCCSKMLVATVIFFAFRESQIITFETRFWLKFIKQVCIEKLLRWPKFWKRKMQNNNFYRLGLEKSQIHAISCPSAMPLLYQSFILNDFCRGPLSNSPIFGI